MTSPEDNAHINLYPELDADLDAAYAALRPENVPCADGRQDPRAYLEHHPYADEWIRGETVRMEDSWNRYQNAFAEGFDLSSLLESASAHQDKLRSLYEQRETLAAMGYKTHAGTNLADELELVAIPWVELQRYDDMPAHWYSHTVLAGRALDRQWGQAERGHLLAVEPFSGALLNEQLLYRNPSDPGKRLYRDAYLTHKVNQDGPWGFMLVQTSDTPGTPQLNIPRDVPLEKQVTHIYELEDIRVDHLGVLEWMAYAMQTGKAETGIMPLLGNVVNNRTFDMPTITPSTQHEVMDLSLLGMSAVNGIAGTARLAIA